MAECRQEHPTWPEPYVRAWCQGKRDMYLNALGLFGGPGRWQELLLDIPCPALLITAEPAQGSIVTPEVASQVQALNPSSGWSTSPVWDITSPLPSTSIICRPSKVFSRSGLNITSRGLADRKPRGATSNNAPRFSTCSNACRWSGRPRTGCTTITVGCRLGQCYPKKRSDERGSQHRLNSSTAFWSGSRR